MDLVQIFGTSGHQSMMAITPFIGRPARGQTEWYPMLVGFGPVWSASDQIRFWPDRARRPLVGSELISPVGDWAGFGLVGQLGWVACKTWAGSPLV